MRIDWSAIDRAMESFCTRCGTTQPAPLPRGICVACFEETIRNLTAICRAADLPKFCARCHHVHVTDAERIRCSAKEDL
jgi:NMD protein affecting ribosome stability and mRNA decay